MSLSMKLCRLKGWIVCLVLILLSSVTLAQRSKSDFSKQFLENKARTVRLSGKDISCTGVIVETNLVLTAYHCTGERMKYRGYPAEVVNTDEEHDLALFATSTRRFDPIRLGEPWVEEEAYTFGHHHRKWKSFSIGTIFTILNLLSTSVEAQSGDSGSGLFNMQDELIGILVRADLYKSYAVNAKYIRCIIRPTVECEMAKGR